VRRRAHVEHRDGDQPALGFESLVETMFTLAAEGKTNRKGLPNPLRLAVIAKAHFDTVRLPRVPVLMQNTGLVAGALLGRLCGYRPAYAQVPRQPATPGRAANNQPAGRRQVAPLWSS
jgi:hypothetical protein